MESAYQVRNQSCPSHISNGLLCGLCLLLSLNHWDQRDMNLHKVSLSRTSLQLTHGLNERSALDIANCTTQFNDANIRALICIINWYSCNSLYPILDCIRKVRHNLYSLPKIVATTLTFDHVLIYLASRDVILAGKCDVEIALIVAEVEVNFSTIVEDKDFSVPVVTSMTQI
jgi:hypothetical protein